MQLDCSLEVKKAILDMIKCRLASSFGGQAVFSWDHVLEMLATHEGLTEIHEGKRAIPENIKHMAAIEISDLIAERRIAPTVNGDKLSCDHFVVRDRSLLK